MTKIVINWIFKTVVGRWVTAILVTSLLSGAGLWWHNFKDGLVEEGTQVCVQAINEQTMTDLKDALAAEKSARAVLIAKMAAGVIANQLANDRRQDLQNQVGALERAMAEQARTDDEYKEWSDAPLPNGVAERLRDQASGSNPDPIRDDQD